MSEVYVPPFFAGLSMGIYCFAYCIPFIAPFLVSEGHSKRENFSIILKFIAGRFVGYVLFGMAVGYLGEKINNNILNLVLIVSMMLLSVALILHAVGLLEWTRFSICARIKNLSPKFPLVMGFLMGINICPPFLISVAYVFTLHSVLKGVTYFVLFFLGTSVYFLPVFFLGLLNRMREFQLAGRIGALVVGAIFLIYGIYNIVRGVPVFHPGT